MITIKQGTSLQKIAKVLENSKIITNQYLFIILAQYKAVNRKIKAGEYELSAEYSPNTILDMLVNGKVKLHKITIPEGLNINEIGAILEKSGFGNRENFIKDATDNSLIESFGIQKYDIQNKIGSFEGYLFPDTYFFPANTDQKKIIKTMVERFKKMFAQEWIDNCKQLGFTVHEIVTLASIIEKETADPKERSLISSVFHNRLGRGMRLESDPTVIYGIQDFNGNITKSDLLAKTPYNTYTISGLPVGPISNPGKLSLHAAIFPQNSKFLFFVSKNDKTHKFSETYEEHNLAVRKYQLKQQ